MLQNMYMLYTINTHNSYLLLSAVWTLPGLSERKIQWAPSHTVSLHSVAWHGCSRVLSAGADLCEKGCPGQASCRGASCRPLQVSLRNVLYADTRGFEEEKVLPNQKWFHATREVKLFSHLHKHWPVRASMLDSQLESERLKMSEQRVLVYVNWISAY